MRTIQQRIFIICMGIFVGFIIGLNINYYEKQSHTPLEIYIAGKYSGDTLHNTNDAVLAGEELQFVTCNYPIVPHLWGFTTSNFHNYTYQQWMDFDRIALEHSNGLLKISSSPGADAEEAYAKSIGLPVYNDIIDVPVRCR